MRTLLIVFAFLLLFDSCKEKRNVKKTYYKSGSIASEVTFKDSDTLIKNGEAKFYYQNGKLKKRHFFINDTLNGDFFSYEESGYIHSKGYFKDGIAIGPIYYYFNNNLILYNERDFDNQIYYVKKYDTLTHNLIKEEGVCISPNIKVNSINDGREQEIQFLYSQPDNYINELSVLINNRPINFDTLKGHIGQVKIEIEKNFGKQLKIHSILKSKNIGVVCEDSVTLTIPVKR